MAYEIKNNWISCRPIRTFAV